MALRRIIVEVDPETLEPADFASLNKAIRALTHLASRNAISIRTSTVRSDTGRVVNPGLMPATQAVLDYLGRQETMVTTQDVASALGVSELHARGQLAILANKGLVQRTPNFRKGRGSQGMTGWRINS